MNWPAAPGRGITLKAAFFIALITLLFTAACGGAPAAPTATLAPTVAPTFTPSGPPITFEIRLSTGTTLTQESAAVNFANTPADRSGVVFGVRNGTSIVVAFDTANIAPGQGAIWTGLISIPTTSNGVTGMMTCGGNASSLTNATLTVSEVNGSRMSGSFALTATNCHLLDEAGNPITDIAAPLNEVAAMGIFTNAPFKPA